VRVGGGSRESKQSVWLGFVKIWWLSSSAQVFSLFFRFLADCVSLNCVSLGEPGCAGRLGKAAKGQAQRLWLLPTCRAEAQGLPPVQRRCPPGCTYSLGFPSSSSHGLHCLRPEVCLLSSPLSRTCLSFRAFSLPCRLRSPLLPLPRPLGSAPGAWPRDMAHGAPQHPCTGHAVAGHCHERVCSFSCPSAGGWCLCLWVEGCPPHCQPPRALAGAGPRARGLPCSSLGLAPGSAPGQAASSVPVTGYRGNTAAPGEEQGTREPLPSRSTGKRGGAGMSRLSGTDIFHF